MISRYNVIPAPEKGIQPRRALPVPMHRSATLLNATALKLLSPHTQQRSNTCKTARIIVK